MQVDHHRPELVAPVTARDHVLGPASAAVTLVEYADFECPYSGRAHRVLRPLLDALGDDLRLVFRHFPLVALHAHAELTAEASEAAAAQGAFWPMHDLLFEHQDALELEDMLVYASDLGLDLQAFEDGVVCRRFLQRVQDDHATGLRSGVTSVPTFFVNGARHEGGHDYDSLLAAVEAAAHAR